MLNEEIGNAFTVETLSLRRHSSGSTPAPTDLFDFAIYMGLCENDVLNPNFDSNFIPGTRTIVFSRDSLHLEVNPDELVTFDLDTPYWYNGVDNLLVEVLWSSGEETGSECVYTWHWNTGAMRCASGLYSASSGSLTSIIPWMQITGASDLETCTFGEVKTLFTGR
ncbi:hypothetical protein GX411_06685 [Candidatus Fermentibacteria bacterium]|nr:hypothetical protein [Candidatus Fermentibacteria bacterium]